MALPKHIRNESRLPSKEKEFASKLTLEKKKIFCGRFNYEQRRLAMKYAIGRRQDHCLTPDEAVVRVMEETGMSLAVKSRRQSEVR